MKITIELHSLEELSQFLSSGLAVDQSGVLVETKNTAAPTEAKKPKDKLVIKNAAALIDLNKAIEEKPEIEEEAAEKPKAQNTFKITVEELRAAVTEKAQAGKREGIKAILTKYETDNVSALEKEYYADFLKDINAL